MIRRPRRHSTSWTKAGCCGCATTAAKIDHRNRPVLLVYSLLKRPYILDLLPDRSMVRSFLRQGFSVYVTDWLPPRPEDAECGLHTYVNRDLARAVECVRRREHVDRVSLVGCCLGALLAAIYTALYPQNVQHLVPFALPFESRPLLAPGAAEYLARMYGNVPAWWLSACAERPRFKSAPASRVSRRGARRS